MIKCILNNEILKYITEIDKNRYRVASVKISRSVANKLRKNSKKKSSYASNKIEGNPLSEKQVDEVIERDEHKHFLKPEQEVRNYFLALNYLEEKAKAKEEFSKKLILDVQKLVEKGASKEKIGLRGAMPPGVLFAVYDSQTGKPDYIPPEYSEIPDLLDELVEYVNTTDDHPLIVAAIVHYQLVTIHPFEDGNGRIARLLVNFILARHNYPMVVVRSRKKKDYLEALHQADLVVGPVPSDGSNASLHDARKFVNWFKKMVTEEVQNDVDFIQTKGPNVWWYDGQRILFRSSNSGKILNLLMTEPGITIAALAKEVGINTSAIQKHLKSMTDKGYIARREKDGDWDVFIIPSA